MKKETFICAINALEKQIKLDIDVSENLVKFFKDVNKNDLLPDNHFLSNALLRILQEEMNDCSSLSWIEYYCFDTDFGRENHRYKAYDENKQPIKLDNAGELYDYLNKINELTLFIVSVYYDEHEDAGNKTMFVTKDEKTAIKWCEKFNRIYEENIERINSYFDDENYEKPYLYKYDAIKYNSPLFAKYEKITVR